MVSNVLSHSVLVRRLEKAQTGHLVQVRVFLVKDHLQFLVGDAVGVEQLLQIFA